MLFLFVKQHFIPFVYARTHLKTLHFRTFFFKFIFAAFYVKFKHEIFLTKNLTTFDGHYSLHSIKIENCNGIKKLYNSIEFLGLKFKYFSVSYS